MSQFSDKYTRRRLRSSYFSVVISISLVLFVLGVFGLLLLNANAIADKVREDFAVTVLLNNEASELEVRQFQKSLQLLPEVKSIQYISKEEAAEDLKKDLEEDFMDFLGYNPLLNVIEINLNAQFVESSLIEQFEKEFLVGTFINEIVYDKPLIQMMNDNIKRIGLFLIFGSAFLTLISIGLINSSIRLSIYSKRFIIKTMQLVGATRTFIRMPFLWRSLRHGLYGGLIACGLILGLYLYAANEMPAIAEILGLFKLSILFAGILLIGMAITSGCTYFALKKYLKLTTDQLYF